MHARTALLCACLVAAVSGASAQSYTQQQLQDTFMGLLGADGLQPELLPGGKLRFRRENRNYVIHVDERDALYFRMTMAFVADDKSASMRQRRLEGCNTATSEVKVVKCFLDEDGDPTFASELFVVVPGDVKLSMARMLRAMDSAFDRYTRRVNEGR